MPKPTQKQLLMDGLKACGWSVDESARTSKYITFTKPEAPYKYFVGKSGALRKGQNATSSISLTGNRFTKALHKVGSRLDCYSSVDQAIQDLNQVYRELCGPTREEQPNEHN